MVPEKIQSDKGICQILMHEILAGLCVRLCLKSWHREYLKGRFFVCVFFPEIKFQGESCRTGVNNLPGWRGLKLEVLYIGYIPSLFEKNALMKIARI